MDNSSITPTPQQLRALTHPVRLRMLGILRTEGATTATALAQRLGLNTGATSYHLRQLAQHGFIVDDETRGNGRERWWQAAHASTRTGLEEYPDPADKEALDAYLQTVVVIYTQMLQQAVEERATAAGRVAQRLDGLRLALPAQPGAGGAADQRRLGPDRGVREGGGAARRRRDRRALHDDVPVVPAPGRPVRRYVVRRPLYGWLGAEGISLIGTRVSMIALPFFVLTTTGSPEKTGLVAVAEMLPLVVLKVLGGPIIDRVGARRVAITCDWASLGVVGAIPLLHEAGLLSFPGFLGARGGRRRAARTGRRREALHDSRPSRPPPAYRWSGSPGSARRSSGPRRCSAPRVAGGLVAVIGPANALIVDAASFGVSALLLAWALPARTSADRRRGGRRPGAVPRAAAGGLAVPARRPGAGRHHGDGRRSPTCSTSRGRRSWSRCGGWSTAAARPRSAPCSRRSPAPPRSARSWPRRTATGCRATRPTSSASWSPASPGS